MFDAADSITSLDQLRYTSTLRWSKHDENWKYVLSSTVYFQYIRQFIMMMC